MPTHTFTETDLRWLVCPVCYQAIHLQPATNTILCTGCTRTYPIVDGLPVLLAARATPTFV